MADASSDLRKFAVELREKPKGTSRKISGALTRHTNRVAATAADLAPRDRPWLATQGIRKDTTTLARRVYVPLDPDGQNVGMHVEFGTSKMAPRPFLLPAFDRHKQEFVDDVTRIAEEDLRS